MDSSPEMVPAWVRKRNGATEPFEAEKINRALFAATETLGRPDAFLARELTDSIVHFLNGDTENGVVSSRQIEETLVKVVRELGQPKIARAVAEFSQRRARVPVLPSTKEQPAATHALVRASLDAGVSPAVLLRRCGTSLLEQFSLEEVFAKNLAAAHREGLLVLGGLDTPRELTAAVIRVPVPGTPGRASGIFEAVEQVRLFVGGAVALDSPERELAQRGARISEVATFLRELELAARTLDLRVILNVGSEAAPSWAEETTPGPLFAGFANGANPERVQGHIDVILDQMLTHPDARAVGLDWHLSPGDFAEEIAVRRLTRLARAALNGAAVRFVFDRPRRPVALAEALDRAHPANLLWVGLHLPRLLEYTDTTDPKTFLGKLPSLARLALSAGVQKRDFIRRFGRPERPPFLLDQAHLGLYLVDLAPAIQLLFRTSESDEETLAAYLQQLLKTLDQTLAREANQVHLRGFLDELPDQGFSGPMSLEGKYLDWKHRLRGASRLHSACGQGTVWLPLPEAATDPGEVVELLAWAWRHTAVNRIAFRRGAERQQQLTVAWHDDPAASD